MYFTFKIHNETKDEINKIKIPQKFYIEQFKK